MNADTITIPDWPWLLLTAAIITWAATIIFS